MTTPSIRETLLTFHARANLATEHLRREAEQLREEAPCLGPAFAGTRRLVTARLGNIEHEADMLERDLVQDVAALLCLRTDDTGGCDIDLPPRRPAGRPTKLEAAARVKVVADPPPADSAPKEEATTPQEQPDAEGPSGLAAAFEAIDKWTHCDMGEARGYAIAKMGYTANELVPLSDVTIRAICKHSVLPSEFGGATICGVSISGVSWDLAADARVVAGEVTS